MHNNYVYRCILENQCIQLIVIPYKKINNDLKYCDGYIAVAGDAGLGLFHEAAGSSLNL